ncbi:Uncharacterised protein [Vibrio cholerae]|uniref:Uncharacterized protein n=1 Tax=Vibrio cholerae TaxID=666 RepID=A0A656AVI4_VIBCL|nr:Uncharacterised protein [Vibrio cholerae]
MKFRTIVGFSTHCDAISSPKKVAGRCRNHCSIRPNHRNLYLSVDTGTQGKRDIARWVGIVGIRSQRPLRTIWSLKGVFQQLCMSSTSGKNRQSPKHRRNFRLEIDHRILHSF